MIHATAEAWCPTCVKVRGCDAAHREQGEDEKQTTEIDEMPMVQSDYTFVEEEADMEQQCPTGVPVARDAEDVVEGMVLHPSTPIMDYEFRPVWVKCERRHFWRKTFPCRCMRGTLCLHEDGATILWLSL